MATPPITIRSKRLQRFLLVGPTGVGKSKIVNCLYNRQVDLLSLSAPADVGDANRLVGRTSSMSSYVDQREKKVFVDTVGYGDARFTMDMDSYLLYFRELICYASIGYNWLFLVLRFERLTQDILTYVEMLEHMLGTNTLSRCTVVFTHCRIKDIDRDKCIEANRESPRIAHVLQNAHSIVFGDMDTLECDDSDDETRLRINQTQLKQRQRFMAQLLERVDSTNDDVLRLDQSWFVSYWTNFKQYVGYCVDRIFGRSNELSKRYRLIATLKSEIPVTIYYESCSICLDLIIEVWNTEPKACVTKCGHVFHYDCLKNWFIRMKQCPNCRADLRTLPERILGERIGLHPIREELKTPSASRPATPAVPESTGPLAIPPTDQGDTSQPPTPTGSEASETNFRSIRS